MQLVSSEIMEDSNATSKYSKTTVMDSDVSSKIVRLRTTEDEDAYSLLKKILESSLFVGRNRLGDCHLQENTMGVLERDGQRFQGGGSVSLRLPGFEKVVHPVK